MTALGLFYMSDTRLSTSEIDFEELDVTSNISSLLKLLTPWVDREVRRYRTRHTEWEKNVLFYLGKHWIEKKSQVEGFLIYEDDDEHFYPVTNYVKLLTDFKLNQVAGKRVKAVVKPSSLSPSDVFNARLGHLALKAKYKIDNESVNDRLVCLHAEIFGLGWRVDFKEPSQDYIENPRSQKVDMSHYDCAECGYKTNEQEPTCPTCGTEMVFTHDVQEQMVIDPQTGLPVVDQIPIYKTRSEVVDPFRILVSKALTAKDRKWLIDMSMQPLRWVRAQFNKEEAGYTGRVGEIKKSKDMPRSLRMSEDLKSAISLKHSAIYNTVTSTDSTFRNDEDSTLFYKAYFMPSKNFKRGRLIVFTPDTVLYDGLPDTPQTNKQYSWWHGYNDFVWSIHPLSSEGVSLVGDLIPKNKQLNGLDAMIMEYMDKTAAPQEVRYDNVQQNTDDNTDVMTIVGLPGLPNGGAPFYLQHPSMASDIYQYRANLIAEMEKQARVPEVVQGIRPAGVDTFRGLKLLREAAESAESDLYNRFYEYVENYNKLKLCLIQECLIVKDPDLTALMIVLNDNEGNSVEAIEDFKGSDLGDQWNIEIEETDYLSDTKAAEQENVKDAITSQIISPAELEDPLMKFNTLQRLGLGDSVETFGSEDIKKALWIIQLLESKKFDKIPSVIKPFDNKPLHLRVLITWMKKPKFYSLDPEIQGMAEQLRASYEQAMLPPPGAVPPPVAGNAAQAVSNQPPPASPSV